MSSALGLKPQKNLAVDWRSCLWRYTYTRNERIGFRSWSRSSTVSLQATEAINPTIQAAITFRQTRGYLHSRRVSPPNYAGTKLYCSVTEAHVRKRIAKGCCPKAQLDGPKFSALRYRTKLYALVKEYSNEFRWSKLI